MQAQNARLTVLFSGRHDRHVIIRRQVATFRREGYVVTTVDQSSPGTRHNASAYEQHRALRLDWSFAIKQFWRVTRRIPSAALHEWFWATTLWVRLLSSAVSMAAVTLRLPADCYVAEDLQAALAALLATSIRKRPVIFCAHELESEQGHDDPIRPRVLRTLERIVIPRVDHLVVPNASRASFLAERCQPKVAPTVVLNCPPRMHVARGHFLHDQLGLSPTTRIVLYHGALIPLRSLDRLVQSAASFPRDVVLVLIGDQGEYYREKLAPLIESPDLEGKVYTLPYIAPDQIEPYVASADLGVVIYENINVNNYLCAPTKLYEFLSMQIPVVACNFPEIRQLLEQYAVGVEFDPADPDSIAQAVARFFSLSEVDLGRVRDDLARAREDFAWENEEQKWLELLHSVSSPSTRRARERMAEGTSATG